MRDRSPAQCEHPLWGPILGLPWPHVPDQGLASVYLPLTQGTSHTHPEVRACGFGLTPCAKFMSLPVPAHLPQKSPWAENLGWA